jgi:hypothetical protein
MEIAIVMVVGNVEDERTFSIVNFMKSTFLNHLATHSWTWWFKCMCKIFIGWKLSFYTQESRMGKGEVVVWRKVGG